MVKIASTVFLVLPVVIIGIGALAAIIDVARATETKEKKDE